MYAYARLCMHRMCNKTNCICKCEDNKLTTITAISHDMKLCLGSKTFIRNNKAQ